MTLNDMIAEWLNYSKTDLTVAQYLLDSMEPCPVEIVCYHAQQSAEKALKAILVKNDIDPPKVHDLVRLCEMCGEFCKEILEVKPIATALNKYGSVARYPNKRKISREEAEIAIQKATDILELVTQKFR